MQFHVDAACGGLMLNAASLGSEYMYTLHVFAGNGADHVDDGTDVIVSCLCGNEKSKIQNER